MNRKRKIHNPGLPCVYTEYESTSGLVSFDELTAQARRCG
jgi:hypothetical protein